MQENTKDKEKYSFLRPTGIETFAFIFSAGALQWLHGTTPDDDGRESATSHCLATSWQGWLLRTVRPKVSTDLSRFQSVRRSIPKNSYQRNGAWAGSASAACWTNWQGWTHRHLPFKGCVRDDIPVPVAVDGKGWQRSFQPVHPQTKGTDRTALNGGKRTDWLISHYSVVPLSGKPSGAHRAFQWLT